MSLEWRAVLEALGQLEVLRLDLLLRLVLAALLGGIIGLEREISGKPAGLRTNLLICVGAALLTELSLAVAGAADPATTAADPARIAAQIVSGIGFLGAGTIIQARGSVVGLTTAATLWVVAAIGMAVGARAYIEAIGTTILVIVALIILGRAEEHLIRRRAEGLFSVTAAQDPATIRRIEASLEEAGFSVDTVSVDRAAETFAATFVVTGPRQSRDEIMKRLLELPGVRKVTSL